MDNKIKFDSILPKQLMACSAIIDIVRIFADTEIGGQYDVNYNAICNYLDSLKFIIDYSDCDTKEDVYERFTRDVYKGLPIWRFLILPEWTKNMVEASFEQEILNKVNKYKCLTCNFIDTKTARCCCNNPQETPRIQCEYYVPNDKLIAAQEVK